MSKKSFFGYQKSTNDKGKKIKISFLPFLQIVGTLFKRAITLQMNMAWKIISLNSVKNSNAI